jgi:hypothetical protein
MFFGQQTRRNNVLNWMVARITRIQSPLKFPPETNFDLLLSFPNIWRVPHFQSIC